MQTVVPRCHISGGRHRCLDSFSRSDKFVCVTSTSEYQENYQRKLLGDRVLVKLVFCMKKETCHLRNYQLSSFLQRKMGVMLHIKLDMQSSNHVWSAAYDGVIWQILIKCSADVGNDIGNCIVVLLYLKSNTRPQSSTYLYQIC